MPEQNGQHYAENIFKYIFSNIFCILILISLKFISKIPNDNNSTLVHVMAYCQTGDKPLPEPMMTHIIYDNMWPQ